MTRKDAWCIHQLRYLVNQVTYETLYYLANVRRNTRPEVNHLECIDNECCVANNLRDSSTGSLHVWLNCTCDQAEAPIEDMHRILRDGGVPVLRYARTSNGERLLSYVQAVPNGQYAAISHVWADGWAILMETASRAVNSIS